MIGIILKNMRLSANLSQLKLGQILSVADTTISSYERENSQPDFSTIYEISKKCGYDILFKDREGNLITVEEMAKEMDF